MKTLLDGRLAQSESVLVLGGAVHHGHHLAVFAPFYQALIWGPEPLIVAIAAMSLLLIWRHEGNIKKLLAGSESKLGQKAAAVPPGPLQNVDKPHALHHGQHHAKHKKGHS